MSPLWALPPYTIIVSGGALGVDQAAAQAALELDLGLIEYFPDWQKHGKRGQGSLKI